MHTRLSTPELDVDMGMFQRRRQTRLAARELERWSGGRVLEALEVLEVLGAGAVRGKALEGSGERKKVDAVPSSPGIPGSRTRLAWGNAARCMKAVNQLRE